MDDPDDPMLAGAAESALPPNSTIPPRDNLRMPTRLAIETLRGRLKARSQAAGYSSGRPRAAPIFFGVLAE
jgi:hypothetical protein